MEKETDCCECCKDLGTILGAWDTLVVNSQSLTDPQLLAEEETFDKIVETVAVKNGHPAGFPRRRP